MATTIVSTLKPSGGDYTTMGAWESGEERNLVTADEIERLEISGDWSGSPDTSACTIVGWTTDATRYIEIECIEGNEASSIWDTTKYIKKRSDATSIHITEFYTKIIGVQVEVANTSSLGTAIIIAGGGDFSELTNCFVRATGTARSIGFSISNGGKATVINGIAWGFDQDVNSYGFLDNSGVANTVFWYNSLAYLCEKGYRLHSVDNGYATAINCNAQNCTDDYNVGGGSWDADSTNNLSDSETPPGSNPSQATSTFVDSSNGDFTLDVTDTACRGNGDDLSGEFTIDINNDTRVTWDIGPDEYIVTVTRNRLRLIT